VRSDCFARILLNLWSSEVNSGTVQFYNQTKGFSFIHPVNGSRDVFIHATALERAGVTSLVEGQKVEFDFEQDQ
jgi:cold shock protein